MGKLTIIAILPLIAVLLVISAGCGGGSHTTYRLTHSAVDTEYILDWDLIVSRCPDIGDYDRIEAFAYRGESVEIAATRVFPSSGE